jgi:tellurite resistance protein TehA-like permease
MAILVHGTVAVLGSAAALAALAGVATASPLMALNAVGFVGTGALSSAAVFYSVALLRIGLHSARKAATTLVAVLAGSAGFMTLVLVLLLTEARFRDEASRFGLHSVAGIGVLVVLATALAVTWHDR